MTSTPNGTLALAAAIATLSGEELRQLLQRRRITAPRAVNDPLGLAIELLRAESVLHALQTLDRSALATLLALSEGAPAREEDDQVVDDLRRRGLVGLDASDGEGAFQALPEVGEALGGLSTARFGVDDTRAEPVHDPTAARRGTDTSTWFGPALAAVSRAAAILRTLARHPARLSRKGAVTVVAQRELAAATHDTPERNTRLTRALRLTQLAVPFTERNNQALLLPSRDAAAWLARPYPERWLALAEALVADLSPALRRTIGLGGDGDDVDLRLAAGRLLEREFPLLPEAEREDADEWVAVAELLGLAVDGWLSPAAIELLNSDRDAALAIAARDFPPAASGVYLQPDLSLIVPGPLAPEDEASLTEIARTEQLGVATTLRLSPGSLAQALQAGREIGEIRSLLERLSLTGMPQPLDYILGDLERKQRTGQLPETPRSRRAEHGAPAEKGRPSPPALDGELEELAERVLEAARSGSGAGDLTRRLELAIRHRSTVRVTAAAGRSELTEHTFVLLPVSLTGGRLRATDQAAGVERTLPISAIVAVEVP